MSDAPRARGRPRAFDEGVALDRARDVFWRRGYAGAGVAELTGAMGLSASSLYAAFGDKRGLFLAVLDRYAATTGASPLAALEEGVEACLLAAARLAHGEGQGLGCLLACVGAEAAGGDPAIRAHVGGLMRQAEAKIDAARDEDGPTGRVVLAAMHALAVRARAGAAPHEVEALARDLARGLR